MTLKTTNPLIVGLTGGIGSGKSSVSQLFEDHGIDVVDADVVAREIVAPNSEVLQQLVQTFGQRVLTSEGVLNRSQLRELVFQNEEAKQRLNAIMHPAIRKRMLFLLGSAQSPYVILSAPLLFENNLDQYTDINLVVDIPKEIQLQRTHARDEVSISQIEAIIASQVDRETRLEKADDIIDNSGDISDLKPQVARLHMKYLALAEDH